MGYILTLILVFNGEVEIEIRDVINKQCLGKPHRNVIIFDGYYLLNPKDNGGDLIIYDSMADLLLNIEENDS